ncbi:hypothetical protein BBP40_004011 [Aspergillus hancockii]|nr:hypothetical protein BBP40_004011 [Aspergillus hancockii]
MGQRSNDKRASKRQEYQEALANHIYERLRLSISPDQVRWKPSTDDGYAWSVCGSKKYLLNTSLSNGTVGRYDTIIKELGRSIEVVMLATLQKKQGAQAKSSKPLQTAQAQNGSFTAMIMRLKDANETLQRQLEKSRNDSQKLMREVRH